MSHCLLYTDKSCAANEFKREAAENPRPYPKPYIFTYQS